MLSERVPLNAGEKESIQSDLLDEVFGLGPLDAMLRDPTVSDILVNNAHTIYIERAASWKRAPPGCREDRHLCR